MTKTPEVQNSEEFGIPGIETNPNIKKDELGRPYRRIRIEEENEMENFLPVSHNGKTYQIKRGEEVEVPQCVVDILEDAIASRLVEVGQDPVSGNKIKELRDYKRIPYQIIR